MNKLFLVLSLTFLSLGCVEAEEFEIEGMEFYCIAPTCPSEPEVAVKLQAMSEQWSPYVDAWSVWEGWKVDFLEPDQWFYPGAKGVTLHQLKNIQILVDFDCPKGLCNGVFDWELGLPLAEAVLPYSTEAEKLEFRSANGLIYIQDIHDHEH